MTQAPGPAQQFVEGEYDHENNRVVSMKDAFGRIQPTNQPRVLGAQTEWLPAETRFPSDYIPRLPFLLHQQNIQFTYDATKNVIAVTYPDADFSPASVRAAIISTLKEIAQAKLAKTDWYVTRQSETGTRIPPEIVAERQYIRERVTSLESNITAISAGNLLDYEIVFDDSDQPPKPDEPTPPGGDGSQWVTDATSPNQEGKPKRPAKPDERNPDGPTSASGVAE